MEEELFKNLKPPEKLYESNTNSKFLYMRHGETFYNKDIKQKNLNSIRFDKKYIDAILTEKGISQAEKMSSILSNLEIEIIYVSPLYRALQTSFLSFKNHPKKNFLIFRIHPLLTSIVTCAHDITSNIQKSKKEFNMNSELKYDWSLFDSFYSDNFDQDLYFLHNIDTIDTQNFRDNLLKKYGNNEMELYECEILKQISDKCNGKIETFKHVWKRFMRFKKYLSEIHKDTLKDNDKKIVIVAHNNLGLIITSKKCYELNEINEFPNDAYDIKNCEIISLFLDENI